MARVFETGQEAVTDTQPLRFEEREKGEVLFEVALRMLVLPIVIMFWGSRETTLLRALPFAGAGLVVGIAVAAPALRRIYAIVIEPDGRVVFETLIRGRAVPVSDLAHLELAETGIADTVLQFRMHSRVIIEVKDCEEFRMAARYLKERNPSMELALPKDVIFK